VCLLEKLLSLILVLLHREARPSGYKSGDFFFCLKIKLNMLTVRFPYWKISLFSDRR